MAKSKERLLDGQPYRSKRAIALHLRADREADPSKKHRLRKQARDAERCRRYSETGNFAPGPRMWS